MKDHNLPIDSPPSRYLTTSLPHHLTGWPLEEAQAALKADEGTQDYTVHVVATAPPVRPQRPEKRHKKRLPEGEQTPPNRLPVLRDGAWRVLRCRIIEQSDPAGQGEIELVVAREQVNEELLSLLTETK